MQSSNTINKETLSGISRLKVLPQLLKYPTLLNINEYEANIKDIFCYVIKHYGDKGLSVLINRQPLDDQVVVLFGSWDGILIDDNHELWSISQDFLSKSLSKYVNIMKIIKLNQAQLFFSIQDGLTLVDMQLSINKMAGPGMIKDIFGKIEKTQHVLRIETIDDRVLNAIRDNAGDYTGDLILKPSRFRPLEIKNTYKPLYVQVERK